MYEPGDSFREINEVDRTVDILTDVSDDDTTDHGGTVASIVSGHSTHIKYNFYRVTQENRKVLQRDLLKAMGMAHLDHEVDIMNISLGNDHSLDGNSGCNTYHQPCKIREAAKKAVDDGITIIAAAGNKDGPDGFDTVSCPSLQDEVISVGGFVSKCTTRVPEDDPISVAGKFPYPPNACWILRSDGAGSHDVYCSGQDCAPLNYTCEDNQMNVPWEGNVDPVRNKPDVLAPATHPGLLEGIPVIANGTSFSTPIVTAGVAEILASVRDLGSDATPQLLRRGLIEGAKELDDGSRKMYSQEGCVSFVYDELGYTPPVIHSSQSDFDLYPF